MITYELLALILFSLMMVGYAYYSYNKKNQLHWTETDGWIYPNIKALLAEKNMISLIKEVKDNEHNWIDTIDPNRYEPWGLLTDADMLRRLWDYQFFRCENDAEEWYTERARLSAAAFVLGIRIPNKLWLYNRDTLVQISIYEILRGPRWLDLNDTTLPYVATEHMQRIVENLRCDDSFLKLLLLKTEKLPSFGHIWDLYREHREFKTDLNNNPKILKKALTLIFYLCDMALPRDYCYLDDEVKALIQHHEDNQ